MAANQSKNTPPGPGIDASGQAVVDPTKNVEDRLASAVQRLDDLRESDAAHHREVARIRAAHAHELRVLETARLDAIRENDQGQVQRAADVAQTALNALASQGTEQAETLRAAVESRAVTQESRLLAALDPIQKDIADLRRVQYEAVGGKTQVTEAQAQTSENQGRTSNQGLWIGIAISAAVMGFGFMSLLIAAGALVFAMTRG